MSSQNKITSEKTSVKFEDQLYAARKNSVKDFGNIEHRLEFIETVNGVEFINDSKATDINSTWYSLEYMTSPVVWIAGNSELENDYSVFSELVEEKVKAIICLGKNRNQSMEILSRNVAHFANVETLEDAVTLSKSFAKEGDAVLFSPGCSGFDLFQNYKDRGQQFKREVNKLITKYKN